MIRTLIPLSSLLISSALLLIGHGLLLILLPIFASASGFSDSQIAFTGSTYFLGFVCGCLVTPFILRRAGHIRSFAVLATLYSAMALFFPWLPEFFTWMLLRFLSGLTIAGLYMVIESWLNARATSENRGAILSVYTVLNMVMVIFGQQLLNVGTIHSHELFGLGALFLSLAIVPVSLTLSVAPTPVESAKINLRKTWRHSHVAVIGAVISGLTTGAFWSLAPIFARENGFSSAELAMFMSATMLGGACFQFPLGRMSDHFDRRIILIYMSLATVLVSLLFVFANVMLGAIGGPLAAILGFLWGGTCMTSYAICLAYANDKAEPSDFVQIASSMLIALGLSSALGGPLASICMYFSGGHGLYLFTAICSVIFAVLVLVRRRVHVLPDEFEHEDNFRTASTLMTPIAYELDPRADEPDESTRADLSPELKAES